MPAPITEDQIMSDPYYAVLFGLIASGKRIGGELIPFLDPKTKKTIYNRLRAAAHLGFLTAKKLGKKITIYALNANKIVDLYIQDLHKVCEAAGAKNIEQGISELTEILQPEVVAHMLAEYAVQIVDTKTVARGSIPVVLTEKALAAIADYTVRALRKEYGDQWQEKYRELARKGVIPVEYRHANKMLCTYKSVTYGGWCGPAATLRGVPQPNDPSAATRAVM